MAEASIPLSREQIVSQALTLLEETGLEGLTTRRLAHALGVKAPALYWHFKDKRALLDAMAQAILLSTDMGPPRPGETWQAWFRRRARGYRDALRAHRDGARLVSNARPAAQTVGHLDAELRALEALGFPPLLALRTIMTLGYYAHGRVLQEQTEPAPADPGPVAAALAEGLPDGRRSALLRAWAEGAAEGPDASFDQAVEVILAGTEAALAQVDAGRRVKGGDEGEGAR